MKRLMSNLAYKSIINLRQKYLSPSLKTFEAYDKPVIVEKASMQYMWVSQVGK